jgi:hypothetical protein
MADSRFDSKGCLTTAGIAALRSAPPGAAPPELATHVATCGRCQDRWLAIERRDSGVERKSPPNLGRTLIIFGVIVLLAIIAMLAMMSQLAR